MIKYDNIIEETKRLAKECLEKKWYPLKDYDDWCSDCAFCYDAQHRTDTINHRCDICYIKDYHICRSVDDWEIREDKTVIIKALEELSRTGYLSEETNEELRDY